MQHMAMDNFAAKRLKGDANVPGRQGEQAPCPVEGRIVDVVVVGGGPAGATAAHELAKQGRTVVLLDKAGRIKPCGGAIPPRLIQDFAIPLVLLKARVRSARMISPSLRRVDMPIGNGFVGMVDRDQFDEWLRQRAADAGCARIAGTFKIFDRDPDGTAVIRYAPLGSKGELAGIRARAVIAADGARSELARQTVRGADNVRCVYAYHEIIRSPEASTNFSSTRCDVHYRGSVSPDFYGWVFPHGATTSVGTGSARKGFSLRGAVLRLREEAGLAAAETLRREGAPIPLKPLRRWDNGRDLILAGDAAGVVAPASGEGIYYAMLGGRLAADAVAVFLKTGKASALAGARKRFLRDHGRVFWVLDAMQGIWYRSDGLRERFVGLCRDPDIQRLTWDAYMNKRITRYDPLVHLRIFFKDLAQLMRLSPP